MNDKRVDQATIVRREALQWVASHHAELIRLLWGPDADLTVQTLVTTIEFDTLEMLGIDAVDAENRRPLAGKAVMVLILGCMEYYRLHKQGAK